MENLGVNTVYVWSEPTVNLFGTQKSSKKEVKNGAQSQTSAWTAPLAYMCTYIATYNRYVHTS